MRRALVLFVAALAGAVAMSAWSPSPVASAVDAASIVATYALKLKGDGWLRGSKDPYRVERVSMPATMTLSRNQPDDGRLHVEIRLPAKAVTSLVGRATPSPAFVGSAFRVGDSMTVIDTGGPTFVNALTLQFLKDGARVAGHWIAAFPATDPASGPASAVGIDFTGRRATRAAAAAGAR